MRYWSVLNETIYWAVSEFVIVLIHIIQSYWKNIVRSKHIYYSIVYHLHGDIVLIVIITSLILLLSPYHPSNQNNMDTDWSK